MNLRESPSEQGNVSLSPLKLFLGRNCFEINFTSKLAEMLKFNMTLNHRCFILCGNQRTLETSKDYHG
ncbi:uncharacterized protein [Physcomitrium patens]|uniref:uncharacterized protein isoform X8 n=1 Tax=Physcomitrium patens TaxID=3218 RepID=UPI003CCCF4B5